MDAIHTLREIADSLEIERGMMIQRDCAHCDENQLKFGKLEAERDEARAEALKWKNACHQMRDPADMTLLQSQQARLIEQADELARLRMLIGTWANRVENNERKYLPEIVAEMREAAKGEK